MNWPAHYYEPLYWALDEFLKNHDVEYKKTPVGEQLRQMRDDCNKIVTQDQRMRELMSRLSSWTLTQKQADEWIEFIKTRVRPGTPQRRLIRESME